MAEKADMKEGRTNLSTAVCDKKVYAFSKAGATDRVDVYDMNTDTWETTVMPGTSTILGAAAVDNRVFVLKEKESSLFLKSICRKKIHGKSRERCVRIRFLTVLRHR